MKQIKLVREFSLSLPETTEEPHFEKISFRVKKKIFATCDEKNNRVCLKFSEADQGVFSTIDKTVIYPVPNKWGRQGWTFFELDKIDNDILTEALLAAYSGIAPKKLAERVRQKGEEQ